MVKTLSGTGYEVVVKPTICPVEIDIILNKNGIDINPILNRIKRELKIDISKFTNIYVECT